MGSLGQPNAAFAGDHGDPDPEVRAALAAAYDAPQVGYLRAVAALGVARLLLPIAAAPDGDMSAVLVQAADGSRAVLAFTGLDSLTSWDPAARPVPCTLDDVAATAVETAAKAVLVDLDGPHPLVIEPALLRELARGRRLVELDEGEFGWLYRADGAAAVG